MRIVVLPYLHILRFEVVLELTLLLGRIDEEIVVLLSISPGVSLHAA